MRKRRHLQTVIAVTSFIAIFLLYMFINTDHSSRDFLRKNIPIFKLFQNRTVEEQHDIKENSSTFTENQELRLNSSNTKTYKILFWDSLPGWLETNDLISKCAYNACYISTDRKDFYESDAVVIYGPSHYSRSMRKKRNKQVWIFMSMESPANLYSDFTHLKGVVNWTWTFRRDSDIMGHYGVIKPIAKASTFSVLPKNKSIAWFVSNCNDRSHRMSYAETLEKYIPVDIYGNCGSLECKVDSEACRGILISKYNFYLSFENSFCRDYITEKSLSRIRDQVIPIVRGGSNYTLYMPLHSYINTASYRTIQSLSEAISKIESDRDLFSEFHRWRQFYTNTEFKTVVDYDYGWCEICKRLHFQEKYERLYADFASWWRGSDEIGKMCVDATDENFI